jgi:hypothetical protein
MKNDVFWDDVVWHGTAFFILLLLFQPFGRSLRVAGHSLLLEPRHSRVQSHSWASHRACQLS